MATILAIAIVLAQICWFFVGVWVGLSVASRKDAATSATQEDKKSYSCLV